MARGSADQSPSHVAHYLSGIKFPCRKPDLLQHAKNHGDEGEVLQKIRDLMTPNPVALPGTASVHKAARTTDNPRLSPAHNGRGATVPLPLGLHRVLMKWTSLSTMEPGVDFRHP